MSINAPDHDQHLAIETDSAVVSAGAGSGKTSVLTRRYARLVVENAIPVDRILALTFTRKAAAEMYGRIYEELRKHALNPFVNEQLARFDRSVISTLDSFCASIVRDGCTAFGVPPTFAVDEERLGTLAEQRALAFLHEHGDDPAIRDLVRLNGFASIWKDGLAVIARDHCDVAGDAPLTESLPAQLDFVKSEAERLEAEVIEHTRKIEGLDAGAAACVKKAAATAWHVRERYDETGALGDAELASLASVSLRCGSSKHEDVALLKEWVRELGTVIDHLRTARATLGNWEVHSRAVELVEEFRLEIVGEKRRSGVLSYHDVLALAIRILRENPGLRNYYKNRFRAIMIDEFQDNNHEQKELLYLLAEHPDASTPGVPGPDSIAAGKLFFVGDEKQSIYRFRGADVSVFRALSDELEGNADALSLGANYRSEPGLITFFNRFFARVFADASLPWEARFAPLRSRDPSPGVTPRVEYWELEKREQANNDFLTDPDAEAFHLAREIRRMVEERGLAVRDGEETRALEYRDIVILMRSTSNQIRLETMLRRLAVPYVSQTARSLFLEAPVNDMYQVLQLALYPNDRVAYAGLLRSPLAGISDEGLVRQLLGDNELFEPADGLGEDDADRLRAAGERYAEICTLADTRPIAELLHTIWYRWGYRYHLLRRREYLNYLEYYELFRELALAYEERGLASFLDAVRENLGQNRKSDDLELLRSDANAVQIMTIHRSKGLEFPVVVLAYGSSTGQNTTVGNRPYYVSGEHGLAFNTGVIEPGKVRETPANYLFSHERELEKSREAAERKRLLYVAATRAECHLVFCGTNSPGEGSLLSIAAPAFAASADGASPEDGVPLEIEHRSLPAVLLSEFQASGSRGGSVSIADVAATYAGLEIVDREYTDLELTATGINQRATERGVSFARPFGPVVPDPLPVDAIIERDGLGAAFGTLCHHLIENGIRTVPDRSLLPAEVVPELSAKDVETWLAAGAALAAGLLDSGFVESLAGEIGGGKFGSGDPGGADRDGAGAKVVVEHEVPFTLRADLMSPALAELCDGARLVRGKIDLLVRTESGAFIVDFKTDRELDPSHYAVQLELYRIAAEAIYRVPARCALYYLRTTTGFLFDTSDNGSILEVHEYHQ